MEHEKASTVAAESGCSSQRLGLWGSVSPVSSERGGAKMREVIREDVKADA